ncbi:MAG: hypothetical protein AABY39_12115 [Nitrospirota bacterium]
MEKKRVFKMAVMALLLFAFIGIPMVVEAGDAKKGEELVHGRPVANCVGCHHFPNIVMPSTIAPDLVDLMNNLYAEKDKEKLRQIVADANKFFPDTMMPSYGKGKLLIDKKKGEDKLSPEEQKKLIEKKIDDIVEYLYSLKKK